MNRNPSSILGGAAKDLAAVGTAGATAALLQYYFQMPAEIAAAWVIIGTPVIGAVRRFAEERIAVAKAQP